jgi:hypothetical protein
MLQSLMNKLSSKLLPKYELTETEVLIKGIIDSILVSEGTEAFTAPISGRYYISNESKGYYIKITDYSITITNHIFTFKEALSDTFKKMLLDVVMNYMEDNRTTFENTVFKNQIELLKNIKENLDNR